MLVWVSPQIVEVGELSTTIRIPLNFRTKNGFNSMFFAAIASGIDLTGGFYGFGLAEEANMGILYKDVNIHFKRRVDEDLTLITRNNPSVRKAIREAEQTGERFSIPVSVEGYCLSYSDEKPVVSATATLSLKKLS